MDLADVDPEIAAGMIVDGLLNMPNIKILRRIPAWTAPRSLEGDTAKLAAFVDTETTGLNSKKHKVIEMAVVPFVYGAETGRISNIFAGYHSFNDPGEPIPPEITDITGITDDMVRGHRIDPDEVSATISSVALCVAHNSEFDRRFAESICPDFASLHWACSMEQVPWAKAGIRGRALDYIAFRLGYFFDGHRAMDDCHAAINMLDVMLPNIGERGMLAMLKEARKPAHRVWAISDTFDEGANELLKERSYRWNDGKDGRTRGWHRVVRHDDLDAELAWLLAAGKWPRSFSGPLSPLNRFTDRA